MEWKYMNRNSRVSNTYYQVFGWHVGHKASKYIALPFPMFCQYTRGDEPIPKIVIFITIHDMIYVNEIMGTIIVAINKFEAL